MSEKINIPSDLQEAFVRLMNLIPANHRNEKQIQEHVLLFLRLKGEEFVRAEIERTKENVTEEESF